MTPEKPRTSPVPEYTPPSDTPTGKFKVKIQKQLRWGALTALLVLIALVAGGILGIIGISRAEAQTAAQSAVAPVLAQQAADKDRVDFLKSEFQRHLEEEARRGARFEAKIDRQDMNQQLILDALNVAKAKRAPPVDGGPE